MHFFKGFRNTLSAELQSYSSGTTSPQEDVIKMSHAQMTYKILNVSV